MQRRKFLKVLAGTAAGVLMGSQLSPRVALAQSSGAAVPGVSDDEIKLGMVAGFSAATTAIAVEFYRGAQAVYSEVNANGGIYGRRISVTALDDAYNVENTLPQTLRLLNEENVFLLSNFVGTPTTLSILPIILQMREEPYLVGAYTGATPLRQAPYMERVFNVRPSYPQETQELTKQLWQAGKRRIGVFYTMSSFGRSGFVGVADALAAEGERITAEATHRVNAGIESNMTSQVKHLREANVDAVVCAATPREYAAFIIETKKQGLTVPVAALSASQSALPILNTVEQQQGMEPGTLSKGMINSQVMPAIRESELPGVQLYRELMDKWQPVPPPSNVPADYQIKQYDSDSLEGFVNARVILEGLRRAGPELTRQGFRAAMESLQNLDLGIGASVTFGPGDHQGLTNVYYAHAQKGDWTTLRDWAAVLS